MLLLVYCEFFLFVCVFYVYFCVYVVLCIFNTVMQYRVLYVLTKENTHTYTTTKMSLREHGERGQTRRSISAEGLLSCQFSWRPIKSGNVCLQHCPGGEERGHGRHISNASDTGIK